MTGMTRILISILISAVTAGTLGAQSGSGDSTTEKKTSKAAPVTMSLIGCVGSVNAAGDASTLSSVDGTIAYRLSGVNMRRYVGHRVTVFGGSDSARVKILGALTPSPNAAAQAGALDPAKAAVAADPFLTSPAGVQQLPQFRVRSVRGLGLDVGCDRR
jgi:hypothetical protein